MLAQPNWIEFHDARIEETIQLLVDGTVIIPFKHLVAYYKVDASRYEVWSCSARLELADCVEFRLTGSLQPDDSIMDGTLTGRVGDVQLIQCIERWITTDKVYLAFGSDAHIEGQVGAVRLSSLRRGERLEDWSGPLRGEQHVV